MLLAQCHTQIINHPNHNTCTYLYISILLCQFPGQSLCHVHGGSICEVYEESQTLLATSSAPATLQVCGDGPSVIWQDNSLSFAGSEIWCKGMRASLRLPQRLIYGQNIINSG